MQPACYLKRDVDFKAVTGERKRPFGVLQAVEVRVARGFQGPGGACGAELLADLHAQGVARFAVGVGELAERLRDEREGPLFVMEGERDNRCAVVATAMIAARETQPASVA